MPEGPKAFAKLASAHVCQQGCSPNTLRPAMDLLSRICWVDDVAPGLLLESAHEPWLVSLSVLVAVVTSYMALSMSDRARVAPTPQRRLGALAAGALSLGGGVWTMHFTGMLVFRFCSRVDYDPWWTLISIVPSLGASWVALRGLSRQRVSARKLLLGGLMMGSGIGLMHCGGMAAVRSTAQWRCDPLWFAASIVVAVALSTLALWLHLRLRQKLTIDWRVRTLVAAVILGSAISGMHCTAMAAARFIGVADVEGMDESPVHVQLAMGIAQIALVASVAAVGFNAAMVQGQSIFDHLRSGARLQALVDTAVDGVVRMDGDGIIVAANRAAENIFGLPEGGLIGQTLSRFVPVLEARRSGVRGVIERLAQHSDSHEWRLRRTKSQEEQAAAAKSTFIANMSKGLVLSLGIDATAPAFHRGDPLSLRQILLNLVGNAVKFSERRSVAALPDPHHEAEGFDAGAMDHVTKAISAQTVLARRRNHLSRVAAEELRAGPMATVQCLGRASEYRDNASGLHVLRMSHRARMIGFSWGRTTRKPTTS